MLLLIDDSPEITSIFEIIATDLGVEYNISNSGTDGLRQFEKLRNQLKTVFVDFFLGDMNADLFLEKLLETNADFIKQAEIKLVILTALPPDAELLQKASAKADCVEQKPTSLADFQKLINKWS